MNHIKRRADQLRIHILKEAIKNRLHIGGMFSIAEIMVDLFCNRLDFEKDTFILSKGHVAFLEYLLLDSTIGLNGDISKFGNKDSRLGTHPETNINFIESPTGSLGNGLGVAIGRAIHQKRVDKVGKTYVILGDGEMNEGSVWEGLQQAPKFGLDNLWIFIDDNELQMTRSSDRDMMNNLSTILQSLGWETTEINGHNPEEIDKAYSLLGNCSAPKAIVAHTVKGKGVKEFEKNPIWHHGSITKQEFEKFSKEISNGG